MASSSCTTETTTYVLEKYSRAYTPKQSSGSSEWQHFTNPILRLILDSKLSPEKTADSSLRMRVVWTMDSNQEVVLEDLDLLAFSSLKDSSSKPESTPLKVVYRDTTFGLRYLYVPESTESQKVYRRFQVSFTTASLALQLVSAIRDVCPCKTNDAANVKNRIKSTIHLTVPSRVPMQRQDTFVAPNLVLDSHNTNPLINPQIQLQRVPTMTVLDTPAAPIPRSINQANTRVVAISLPPSAQSDSHPPSSPVAPGPSPYQAMYDHSMLNAPQAVTSMLAGPGQPGFLKPPPSSLPDSSPPLSTADSTMMPPPSFQAPDSTGADNSAVTAALRDATGIYDLSHAALERLVGDVVREDGFVHLVSAFPIIKRGAISSFDGESTA
ncbi:hypothetical protein MSAN_01043500 [Mycena sanguinolenta]|uniref:Uncharacterized protein n=1 Tax=Mycena sanguinolenta TaxID=230812 RepID=A0A8H6YMI5_9AGAR|nr:hypothetical protein MSAN_01043500 [Mycena sanguinolenta]